MSQHFTSKRPISNSDRVSRRSLFLGVLLLFTGVFLTLAVTLLPILGPAAPVVSLISGAVTIASVDILTAYFRTKSDR